MASTVPLDTARKPSGKKAKKLSQEEQSERFKETARELEVDESGQLFEQATRALLTSKKRD